MSRPYDVDAPEQGDDYPSLESAVDTLLSGTSLNDADRSVLDKSKMLRDSYETALGVYSHNPSDRFAEHTDGDGTVRGYLIANDYMDEPWDDVADEYRDRFAEWTERAMNKDVGDQIKDVTLGQQGDQKTLKNKEELIDVVVHYSLDRLDQRRDRRQIDDDDVLYTAEQFKDTNHFEITFDTAEAV